MIEDRILKSLLLKYQERALKGFAKYGQTMERKDLDHLAWLKHLQEELMDASLYLQRLITDLEKENNA